MTLERPAPAASLLFEAERPSQLSHRLGSVKQGEMAMGRALLLWLLGVPIPIIILIALFWH